MMFMNTDNNHDNDGCDDNGGDSDDNDNSESHYVKADDNESCRMRQLCSVSGQS